MIATLDRPSSTIDSSKQQRLVIQAMRLVTSTLQACCKNAIANAKPGALDDGARTYLLKWSSQMTAEYLVDWLANDVDVHKWIEDNNSRLLEAGQRFWVVNKFHPKPNGLPIIIKTILEGDYLFLSLCLEERAEETRLFFKLLCNYRMLQELGRYQSPTAFRVRTRATTHDGDEYTMMGKLVPPVSWAFNGNSVRAPRFSVTGGDVYAAEQIRSPASLPSVYVPRAFSIIPRGAKRKAYQECLPFTVDADANDARHLNFSLLADSVDNAAMVFGEKAAKLVCVMFSSAPVNGGVAIATLNELAQQVLPTAKRVQARDFREIVASLRAIRDLLLVIDNDSDMQLFTVSCPIDPTTAHKDQRVSWAFSEQTRLALSGDFPLINGQSLNGWFLINYTRIMKIPGRYVRAISMYLRIAAQWNTCKNHDTHKFESSRQKPQLLDDFLVQCDALSPRTISYLKDPNPKDQVGLCARVQDRKGGKVLLDVLVEHGLIESWECPEKPGYVLFKPTIRDLEAMDKL